MRIYNWTCAVGAGIALCTRSRSTREAKRLVCGEDRDHRLKKEVQESSGYGIGSVGWKEGRASSREVPYCQWTSTNSQASCNGTVGQSKESAGVVVNRTGTQPRYLHVSRFFDVDYAW